MNPFTTWKPEDVEAHNERVRMKTAKQHNAEQCGESTFIPVYVQKSKRLRQSEKPLMNKLESEWYDRIRNEYPNYPPVRAQAKRYRLCNGVVLTPDFTASSWPNPYGGPAKETAWEIKGKIAWDDAIVKIKMAAHEWPEVQWIFCWKDNGEWKTQTVLP